MIHYGTQLYNYRRGTLKNKSVYPESVVGICIIVYIVLECSPKISSKLKERLFPVIIIKHSSSFSFTIAIAMSGPLL